MFDQLPLFGLFDRLQWAFRIGGVTQQMERFFEALVFLERQHHDNFSARRTTRGARFSQTLSKCFLKVPTKLGE
jgi:hypothetical protein